LFSENQFCEKASIASHPGFQNKELNLGIFEQGSNKDTIFGVEPFGTQILAVLLDANS
jgi:hypothetical protein